MPTIPQTAPHAQRGVCWWLQTRPPSLRSHRVARRLLDFHRQISASIFSESRAPDRGPPRSDRRSILPSAAPKSSDTPISRRRGFGDQLLKNKSKDTPDEKTLYRLRSRHRSADIGAGPGRSTKIETGFNSEGREHRASRFHRARAAIRKGAWRTRR